MNAQDPQNRLVSFTTDRVAADRKSGESVNDAKYGENVNGDTSVKHVGLSYKWPFHAKKQTYKFYDPISGQAPDARFIGTEKLAGLNLYKYQADINNIDLPVGPGIPGKYSDTRTVWVDPVTGVIVKGSEHQVRTLADGTTALDTTLTFNQDAINYQAKQAKDGRSKITMLTVVLPLVGLVLGIVAADRRCADAASHPGPPRRAAGGGRVRATAGTRLAKLVRPAALARSSLGRCSARKLTDEDRGAGQQPAAQR